MRPQKAPLANRNKFLATAINRARSCGFKPDFQEGVRQVAEAIADEHMPPSQKDSFLLACGV